MKRITTSLLCTAAACAFALPCAAQMAAPKVMTGAPGAVAALPPLGPEFGYETVRKVQPLWSLGGFGEVKTIVPPDVVKLEAHVNNAALPEDFRVKAVQTIATLSMYQPAIASLERTATKDPDGSPRLTKEAIAGLGNSQHPEAKAALERIVASKTALPFQKKAAMAALENIAATWPGPGGYW